ncbi:MAG: zf-HC2 domain-containing protein [Candidatus Limnocylindrales bacterium]
MSDDLHEPFRRLLAERLDGPLEAGDAASLEVHLGGCPACRSVAHDYEVDRERMRAIQAPEPPRDLWARTSAALDREIADDADALLGPGIGGIRGHRQLRVAIGSFVTATIILAITGGQLMPDAPTGLATATPFAIPAQPVNYVGVADGELTFYRADVREVCPVPRLDCADGPDGEAVVRLGSSVNAHAVAMNRTGQLFIAGHDDLGEEVFAIVTVPAQGPKGAAAAGTPSTAPDESVAPADASAKPIETRNPDVGQADPPTAEPTDGPDVLPSATADGTTDPAAVPSISPPPSPTTAVASSQAILTNVVASGAAAAWSPDGSTLAFSAIPADRSHGSDVYVWRPGDEQAHPITDDHGTLFASWSGDRIVVSRTEAETSGSGDLVAQTLVVDPGSGETRAIDLERAWLPSVDPTGRFVIYWRGRLADRGGVATPDDGRLYVADWTSLDPWARETTERSPDASTTATDAPSEPPQGGDPSLPATNDTGEAAPVADPATDGSTPAVPPGDVDAPPADVASEPTDAPGATVAPKATIPPFILERPRAVSGRTRDWVVRWSADGRAYAVWTAEPGSKTRGSLIVRSAPSGDAPTGVSLVDRVRAGRSFGLGDQRVAWVAPLADGEGELWVSAWGERGQGSVKLRRVDSLEAVPAS